MKRICKECGEEKEIEEFVKDKTCKYGYAWDCKECRSLHERKYRQDNKEEIAIRRKCRYQKNKEYVKRYGEKYRINNKAEINKRQRTYNRKARKDLKRVYVKDQIKKMGVENKDITPQMIELKRELMLFHRLLKEVSNGINGGGIQGTTANT